MGLGIENIIQIIIVVIAYLLAIVIIWHQNFAVKSENLFSYGLNTIEDRD